LPELSKLYDQDFVMWTEQQAALLRRAKDSNLPLDWENLAEEIESLGKSNRRELRSQTRRILRHLLKLEASPAAEPRAGWRATIRDARSEIEDLLRDSPSLRREVDALAAEELSSAADLAAEDMADYGELPRAIEVRRAAGGFTAEQVLDDWFPSPPG
jgi:hypothetical protein